MNDCYSSTGNLRGKAGFALTDHQITRSRAIIRFLFIRHATISFVENRSGIFGFAYSACDLSGETAALVP
jgi:hypothetical protein